MRSEAHSHHPRHGRLKSAPHWPEGRRPSAGADGPRKEQSLERRPVAERDAPTGIAAGAGAVGADGDQEKEAFSRRLRQALAAAGEDDRSPTRLFREFNRRHKGGDVSIHSAHKWLRGETIPTQDKLRTLAAWLGVTPEWLRYGETDVANAYTVKEPALSEGDLDVARQFRRLNAGHRQLVREMLLSLLSIEQRK